MKSIHCLVCIMCVLLLSACESAHSVTKETGRVVTEGAKVVGGVSEGGAEAMQGIETEEENPFGR